MSEDEEIRLEREIHIMKHVTHPNIVEFHDFFVDHKRVYLVLEYLGGGDLYEEILDKEVFTEHEARKIILAIVDSVRYLHESGIVHRDLKVMSTLLSLRIVSILPGGKIAF